jgi:hypothetical protein
MAIQRKDKERRIASAFEVQGFDFMSFPWNDPDGMDGMESIVRRRKESY